MISFLAKWSNSFPTRSAASIKVHLPLTITGLSLCSQYLKVAATSLLWMLSFSLSTQFVRNSSTSALLFTAQSASQNWPDVKSLGFMSIHIPNTQASLLFQTVFSSKLTKLLPYAAHSLSLQQRCFLRQLAIICPQRSITAAELQRVNSLALYSTASMQPKTTQVLSLKATERGNQKSTPSFCLTEQGKASAWLAKLQPEKAISGKRTMSKLSFLEYFSKETVILWMVAILFLQVGLIWHRRALMFLLEGCSLLSPIVTFIQLPPSIALFWLFTLFQL